MLDHQRIVEEIQAALAGGGPLDWTLLRDTAAEYAQACDQANQRLAGCGRLLAQGLRCEALQAAEREPNLLDVVAVLDFPELPLWKQALAAKRMGQPPALRIDVAGELNAAYAVEAPLQTLLKRHRLLALARAPLAERIRTLREIARHDADNPVWTEDVRRLEAARQRELRRDLESALQARDLQRAWRVILELNDPNWTQRPPASLVEDLQQRYQAAAARLALEEMPTIERALHAAFQEGDVAAGRAARERWAACQRAATLPAEHPLMRQAAPALRWLADEDAKADHQRGFEAAVERLSTALENAADQPELDRRFDAALRYEQELPKIVVRRYEERRRTAEDARRRRFMLLTMAVVGLLVLASGGLAWLVLHRQHEAAVARAVEGLEALLKNGNLNEARQFYDTLTKHQPAVAARAEVQQRLGQVSAHEKQEQDRRARFQTLLAQAQAAGLENPDQAAASEAKELASTPEERAQIEDWLAQLAARDRQRQQERDERFQKQFEALVAGVEQLERSVESGAGAAPARFSELLAAIDALQSSATGVTTELASQVKPLRLRVSTLSSQAAHLEREQASLARITAAVGQPRAFQTALSDFLNAHGESPLAGQLRLTLEEAPWWNATAAWCALLADWRMADLRKLGPKEARELLQQAEPLRAGHGDLPWAEWFQTKHEFLTAVANRLRSDGEPLTERLRIVFDDKLIREVWTVRLRTSDYGHYLLSQPRLDDVRGGRILLRVVTGFDLTEKNLSVVADEIEFAGVAPQSQLAARLREQRVLARIAEGEWERGFFELLTLVAEWKDVDPLLRLLLLRRVVETGRQGSHSLDVAWQGLWSRLESVSSRADLTANWLLPDDEPAKRSRIEAATALAGLEPIEKLRLRASEVFQRDVAPLGPLPQWIGWLRPQGSTAWQVATRQPLPLAGELYVLGRAAGGEGELKPRWGRIGTCYQGEVRWDAAADELLVAGRPVYLVPSATAGESGAALTATGSP